MFSDQNQVIRTWAAPAWLGPAGASDPNRNMSAVLTSLVFGNEITGFHRPKKEKKKRNKERKGGEAKPVMRSNNVISQ